VLSRVLQFPVGRGPQACRKGLAYLLVQLRSHVSKACTHVSKASDVRAIMGLQYVRAGIAFNACMSCGHAATALLQYHHRPY
jgi:hypothetical protein